MAVVVSPANPPVTRRSFLKTGVFGAAGLALYSGEVERHWLDVTRHQVQLRGLPASFDGMTIAQLSDIHLDEFTEPFFLREAVSRINHLNPNVVCITGDFVTHEIGTKRFAIDSAWRCANILTGLKCRQVYAVLGNHDVMIGEKNVTAALTANGIPVLHNQSLPIERGADRIWLAGVDDPVCGGPDPDRAIPASIRNLPHEPIVLLCHAPDYADTLLRLPSGQAVSLMLSGHTHGGQVRLPFVRPMFLPGLGRKYVEGSFRLGGLQLYVNRGLGTVGVPFRFDCPPEITLHTLRTA